MLKHSICDKDVKDPESHEAGNFFETQIFGGRINFGKTTESDCKQILKELKNSVAGTKQYLQSKKLVSSLRGKKDFIKPFSEVNAQDESDLSDDDETLSNNY